MYLVFGGPSVARSEAELDGRVALDLASPLFAGMRGLGGGAVFAGENVRFPEANGVGLT